MNNFLKFFSFQTARPIILKAEHSITFFPPSSHKAHYPLLSPPPFVSLILWLTLRFWSTAHLVHCSQFKSSLILRRILLPLSVTPLWLMSGKISSNVQHLCDTQVRKPVDAHKKSTKGVYFVPHAYLENTTACHVWNTSKFFLADCIWTQLANLLLSSFFFF